jgi:hypothetical protein
MKMTIQLTRIYRTWQKVGLRGKFIAMNTFIKKSESSSVRLILENFEILYCNKMANLEKNEFLDQYDAMKLSQKDIKHLNSPIPSNEIKSLQQRNS